MIRRAFLFLLSLLLAGTITQQAAAQGEPKLVPDVSQRQIAIESGFTGAELLLFGAIIHPRGAVSEGPIDVAVVLRGPSRAITLHEKQRILGIWINAESKDFFSVPSYYAIASSRPIKDIVDPRTADIYELGINRLQLSPTQALDQTTAARFERGLVDLNRRGGLFRQNKNKVQITDSVLYRARLQIPSTVPVGTYIAETLLIRDGKVIQADDSVEITIRKRGFERFITVMADQYSLIYGIAAVLISLLLGWIAAKIFQRQ